MGRLELSREDFSPSRLHPTGPQGVGYWTEEDPKRKRSFTHLGWRDLILCGPRFKWPTDLAKEEIKSWGKDPKMVIYVPSLADYRVRDYLGHPKVQPYRDLRRGDGEPVEIGPIRFRVWKEDGHFRPVRKPGTTEATYYVSKDAMNRVCADQNRTLKKLDARLIRPEWAPIPVLVTYVKERLRSVHSLVTISELEGAKKELSGR